MADTAELEFLVSLRDEATQALHGLEGVLRDVTGPLPDIVGGIDISSDGATTAAFRAAQAADQIPEGFEEAGRESGQRLRDEFGRFLPRVSEDAAGAGEDAGEELTEGTERGIDGGKAALLAGVAAVAVAAGALFSSALAGAMETETANAKLTGQLGLTAQESARFGALAGDLYAANYGESIEDVNGSIASVVSAIGGLRDASDADISAAAVNAMNLASTFDIDVADAATSAGILIKTGLAGNATEAFDIITASAQKVGPAMVDPLLEASNEYSTYFQALGFSAEQAFTTLTTATAGGEIALDKAGDAIKEFGIRATDGSKSTAAAYEDLGLNMNDTVNAILAGGPAAQAATQQVVSALLSIHDPGTQAADALALFGTPLEDIGVDKIPEFLQAMQGAGGEMTDVAGRADALNATLGGTTAATLETVKRQFQQTFGQQLGAVALPILSQAIGLASQFAGPLMAIGGVLGTVAVVMGVVAVATMAWNTAQTIATVATSAWTTAQWLLTSALAAPITPILAVIALIAVVVAAIIWFFTQTEIGQKIVETVWNGIKSAIAAVSDWITGTAVPAIVAAWQWVVDKAQDLYTGIKGIFDRVIGFIREWWPLLMAIFMPALFLLLAAWNKWGDDIVAGAKRAWAFVRDSIIIPVGEFVGWVMTKLVEFGSWLAAKWTEYVATVRTAWALVKAAVVTPVAEFLAEVAAKLAVFVVTVTQPIRDAIAKAREVGAEFKSVGSDIIEGIIDGVTSKAKALASTVANAARDALSAAKNALGIKSPSRVFRDEVGAMLGEGWAIGVEQSGADVVAAAEAIAAQAAAAASAEAGGRYVGGVGRPVSLGPSEASSRAAAGAVSVAMPEGYTGPSEIVVVDADGALVGRMRVEAGAVLTQGRQDDLVSARQNGRGR